MADCDNTFRVQSITHGATALAQPVGFSFTEDITWMENYPGIRKAPCTALDRYSLSAEGEYQGGVTPIVRGTTGSLVVVLLQLDAGTTTITMTAMLAGACSLTASNGSMATYKQAFKFNSAGTDDLAPISVA